MVAAQCGMHVITMPPPFFDRICATFPDVPRNKRVIFTFGHNVYNPWRVFIPPELFSHEAVHGERQGGTWDAIVAWWERYLLDPGYRFEEELPAHQAEYHAYCRRHGDRGAQAKQLQAIALKLAGPVYGNMCTQRAAARAIIEGESHEFQRTARAS